MKRNGWGYRRRKPGYSFSHQVPPTFSFFSRIRNGIPNLLQPHGGANAGKARADDDDAKIRERSARRLAPPTHGPRVILTEPHFFEQERDVFVRHRLGDPGAHHALQHFGGRVRWQFARPVAAYSCNTATSRSCTFCFSASGTVSIKLHAPWICGCNLVEDREVAAQIAPTPSNNGAISASANAGPQDRLVPHGLFDHRVHSAFLDIF